MGSRRGCVGYSPLGMDDDERDIPEGFDPAGDPRVEFLCAAGAVLARYGARTNRLESRLAACACALGVEAQFYVLPTAIFAAFGSRSQARTVLINTEEVSVDLRGLTLVGEVLNAVTKGEMDPRVGLSEVHRLTSPPARFAWYWRILAAGLSATAIVVLLGGGQRSFLPAALVGLGVGILIAVGLRTQRLVPLLELLAGILAAALAAALWHVLPHFAIDIVVLAGLTPLVPGLAITRGVSELAAGHVVSGTSRLAGAAIVLATLAFGVALGTYTLGRLGWMPPSLAAHGRVPELVVLASIVAGSVAFLILMNAQPRDFAVIVLAWVVAVYGLRLGAWLAGATLGIVVAAALLGVACNLYGRYTGRPSAVPRVPGLVVLVPGAFGFRSVAAVFDGSTAAAGILVSLAVIAVGLVVGLLIADSAIPVPPTRRGAR